MTSLATYNVFQVIAGLLIFIASYLALLLLIVICFVIAELVHEGARLGQAYTVKCSSLDDSVASEIRGHGARLKIEELVRITGNEYLAMDLLTEEVVLRVRPPVKNTKDEVSGTSKGKVNATASRDFRPRG